ncbi:MAG: hypothetical protein NVSMB25_21890 [Thermoleophilaceae bacterium]
MRKFIVATVCTLALGWAATAPAPAAAASGGVSYTGRAASPAQDTGGAVPGRVTGAPPHRTGAPRVVKRHAVKKLRSRARAKVRGRTGGVVPVRVPPQPAPLTAPPAGDRAVLAGLVARPPQGAPAAVVAAIAAANSLQDKPYLYGGGHASFVDRAYDCSGAVSYALHGAGLLTAPLASPGLMTYGLPGPGRWITIVANAGHAYVLIAGLRLDTSGMGQRGPRWRTESRSDAGFTLRHPVGL